MRVYHNFHAEEGAMNHYTSAAVVTWRALGHISGKEDVPESRIHAPEMPLMYQNKYGEGHAYRWTVPEQGRLGYNANSDPTMR